MANNALKVVESNRGSSDIQFNHINNLLNITETFYEKEGGSFPKEWSVFNKIFNKKNISRKECLLLPFKTLAKALNS